METGLDKTGKYSIKSTGGMVVNFCTDVDDTETRREIRRLWDEARNLWNNLLFEEDGVLHTEVGETIKHYKDPNYGFLTDTGDYFTLRARELGNGQEIDGKFYSDRCYTREKEDRWLKSCRNKEVLLRVLSTVKEMKRLNENYKGSVSVIDGRILDWYY